MMSFGLRKRLLEYRLARHLLSRASGFTLIELLVVIVIVGVLTAVAVPTILQQIRRSRIAEAQAGLTTVKSAAEVYRSDYSQYPPTGAAGYDEIKVDSPNAKNQAKYMDIAFTNMAPNYQNPTQISTAFNGFLSAQGAIWRTKADPLTKAYRTRSLQLIDCRIGQGVDTAAVITGDYYVGNACNINL